jgi:hypothetical protein
VNDELGRVLKEAVVPNFEALSRHSPGGTEEIHEMLRQGSRSPGKDLNPGPPEYEAGC